MPPAVRQSSEMRDTAENLLNSPAWTFACMEIRPVSHARSQHERNNPGRRAELKKRSDAFKESERRKRGYGTVKPGTFAGETGRKGLIGAPLSTKLWTGSKQKRVFT